MWKNKADKVSKIVPTSSNEQTSVNNAQEVADFEAKLLLEQNWNHNTAADTAMWDAIAEKMINIFAQSGHPVFPPAEIWRKEHQNRKAVEPPFIPQLIQKTYRCS